MLAFTYNGSADAIISLDTGSNHFVNAVVDLIGTTPPNIIAQDTTGAGTGDNPYSALLWENNNPSSSSTSRAKKGNEFLPRLLYWNKYSPPTVAAGYDIKLAKVQTWANTSGFILANAL